MDFYSSWAQGFARVAACTLPIVAVDPERNADARHRPGARPRRRRRGGRDLPRAVPLGLRHRRPVPAGPAPRRRRRRPRPDRRGHRRPASRGRRGGPAGEGLPRSTTAASSSTAAASSVSRRSPTCPTTASSTRSGWFASGAGPRTILRGQTGRHRRRRRRALRPRPDLPRDDVPGFVLHVEVCEDMWVPVPPSHEAALAGADGPDQPLGVARSPSVARRGPPPARPLARAPAATRPTSTPPRARVSSRPTCRGTA